MRRREDIEVEGKLSSFPYYGDRLILEVLLDMRELLEDIKEGRRE